MTRSTSRKRSGLKAFTLTEVMIVLLVISIIATIAYPTYVGQMRKSRRAVAKSALLQAANQEEQYFFANRAYGSLTDLGYSTSYFGNDGAPSSSADAVYQLTATTVNSGTGICGTAPCFELQAIPQNDQVNDSDCGTFTLTSDNTKGAASGACW